MIQKLLKKILKKIIYILDSNTQNSIKTEEICFPPGVSINKNDYSKVVLNIKGENNIILVEDLSSVFLGQITINIFGNNCKVHIKNGVSVSQSLTIVIGNSHKNYTEVNDVQISIGENTTFESTSISTFNSGAVISIGKNCMFAFNTLLLHTDAHPIFDKKTNNIVNFVDTMKIGDHCWIGNNATVLKNVCINNDCIIGLGSIVTKSFEDCNVIIAGNPAKIVKKNIDWASYSYEYSNNNYTNVPKIIPPIETIKKIVKDHCSFCRFGDGEFTLINRESDIGFQKESEEISKRLSEVLNSNNDNILIATNYFYFSSLLNIKPFNKKWSIDYLHNNRRKIENLLSLNKTYYSAEFTSMYVSHENIDFDEYYCLIKKIWENRDLTIIQGKGITDNFQYNIFDNSNSINYLYAPSKNAYEDYQDILEKSKKIPKENLIIIILGPTATVLAYDLALLGYQALDLGHIAKDYDWYKRELLADTSTSVTSFFSPD